MLSNREQYYIISLRGDIMKRNFDKEISNMILALSVTLAKEWGFNYC